ncbi:MAG: hypothetical protein LBS00_12770 [Synergistaceae bacterium]|jgi:hypothetical protein|nr:hypothetical protein [Synergistaceae bacterium]
MKVLKNKRGNLWILLIVAAFALMAGGCGGGGGGDGDGGGYTPTTPTTPSASTHFLTDKWDISSGSGTATGPDGQGGYTLELQSGGTLELDVGSATAGSMHAAAEQTFTATVSANLTWNVLKDGQVVKVISNSFTDDLVALHYDGEVTYWFTRNGTEWEITIHLAQDGSITLKQKGELDGYKYENTSEPKGFLYALNGTWIGSNGHATGVVEGVSGTATLVDGGTASIEINRIAGNIVTGSVFVDAEWVLRGGGYSYTESLYGGTFNSVTMQRLGPQAFSFTYTGPEGQETVEITLTSKTAGHVKQTANYPSVRVSYSGTYDIRK